MCSYSGLRCDVITREVAARLHKKTTALGPTRANLINKGLIYSPDHGVVAYTVPAMAGFVKRQET